MVLIAVTGLIHPVSATVAHDETVFIPHEAELGGVPFGSRKNVTVLNFSEQVGRNRCTPSVPQRDLSGGVPIENEVSGRSNRPPRWGNGVENSSGRVSSAVSPYLFSVFGVLLYQLSSHFFVETLCGSDFLVKVRYGQRLCGAKCVSPSTGGRESLQADIEGGGFSAISKPQSDVIVRAGALIVALLTAHRFYIHESDPSSLIQSKVVDGSFKRLIGGFLTNAELPPGFSDRFSSGVGSLLGSFRRLPHLISLKGGNAGIKESGNNRSPRCKFYGFLYAILAVTIGAALSFHILCITDRDFPTFVLSERLYKRLTLSWEHET